MKKTFFHVWIFALLSANCRATEESVTDLDYIGALMNDVSSQMYQHQFKLDDFLDVQYTRQGFTTVSERTIHKETMKATNTKHMAKGRRAARDYTHQVVFLVQHLNLLEAESILNDIANPSSVNFGNHMTREQVNDLTTNPESTLYIASYLRGEGVFVSEHTAHSMYLSAEAPVHVWERILSTRFYEYSHVRHKDVRVVRAEQYSLPESLSEHVTAVFNTIQMPDEQQLAKRKRQNETYIPETGNQNGIHLYVAPSYNKYITPAVLNRFYNISSNNGQGLGSQAVYGALGQTVSPTDLAWFRTKFELPTDAIDTFIGGHSSNDACVVGGSTDTTSCGEANLDIQYLMAVAYNVPTTWYYWAGTDYWLAFCQSVSAMNAPPLVITISYSSYESAYPASYMTAFNTEALKLSLMGVTLLSASGDDGVMGFAEDVPSTCGYDPQFPASSPYVTAVGATMGPETTGNVEVACSSAQGGVITSGGGFSTVFSTPAWQSAAVAGYLQKMSDLGQPPHKGYAAGGRGYPDVSLAGYSYLVGANKQLVGMSGTSASTPAFAGFVSLVNAKRLAAGKSALGWINPSLYALSDKFTNDITSGENNCIINAVLCCEHGFQAATGWDPVTGLGSINYGKFEAAFLALGNNIDKPTAAPSTVPASPTATLPPVLSPTAMPTAAPGWFYETAYNGTDCVGQVVRIEGMATGQCLPYVPKVVSASPTRAPTGPSQTPTGLPSPRYAKIYCNDDIVTFSLYSSSSCTESTITARGQRNTDFCAVSASKYGLNAVVQNSYRFQCTSGAMPVSDSVSFLVNKFYPTSDCTSSVVSSFVAVPQNVCIPKAISAKKAFSVLFADPSVMFYNGSTCIAQTRLDIKTSTVSTSCTSPHVPTTNNDNYYSYQDDFALSQGGSYKVSWQGSPTMAPSTSASPTISLRPTMTPTTMSPTVAPSFRPTTVTPSALPTFAPTSAPTKAQLYQFDVVQNLAGITAAEYTANFAVNNLVFCHAVHVSIAIREADCTVHGVSNSASSTTRLRSLTVGSVNVDYTVAYNLVMLGYANAPDTAFSALTSGLVAAVSSGNFTTALQTRATSTGNTALSTVSSSSVTPGASYSAVGGSDNKKKTDNTVLIVAVVVGVGGGLMLLVALVVSCSHFNKSKGVGPA